MIHNHWLSIAHHDSQPLAQHCTPWYIATGSAYHTMIHNLWFSIAHHDSHPLAEHNKPRFTTTGSAQHTMIPYYRAQHSTSWFTTALLSIIHHDSQPLHGLSIPQHDSQPQAQNNSPWSTTTGSASHSTIRNHWLIIAHHNSQFTIHNHLLSITHTPWFTPTGSE